jgi:lysophospholipid acyltransferase 1/2
MWFTALNLRIPFYFAWTLADLVCNASGLGFNGYDEYDRPKWDLLTNIDIKNIEVRFDGFVGLLPNVYPMRKKF